MRPASAKRDTWGLQGVPVPAEVQTVIVAKPAGKAPAGVIFHAIPEPNPLCPSAGLAKLRRQIAKREQSDHLFIGAQAAAVLPCLAFRFKEDVASLTGRTSPFGEAF